MGVDRSDGCFICPKCGEHVAFSRAEFHPCPIDAEVEYREAERREQANLYETVVQHGGSL